jgi:hypothetical protein
MGQCPFLCLEKSMIYRQNLETVSEVRIRKGLPKLCSLTHLPLVVPRGVEHNTTKIPIIGEDKTPPGKSTKDGWQERQQ